MSAVVTFDLPVTSGLSSFKLPAGVQQRLTLLLDQQDAGKPLAARERREAEGLVAMAEFLSLLKLRARNAAQKNA